MTVASLVSTLVSTQTVIGFPVASASFEQQSEAIVQWSKRNLSKVVCVANVHMLTEASWDAHLAEVLHEADLVTPDGMPLVWMIQLLKRSRQDRVAGMDLMQAVCRKAEADGIGVFFLGSEVGILAKMRSRLDQEFPQLRVLAMESLPFRPLTAEEDAAVIDRVNASGAGVVFLSLGCPKQEFWMAQHRGHIKAVMVGLGGVFPVYAGIYRRAPATIRAAGLEWFYRLVQEPRRLWGRYSRTIPPFLWMALKQLILPPSWRVERRASGSSRSMLDEIPAPSARLVASKALLEEPAIAQKSAR
jgi:N-acetylglucosaminyldiphosphoundecaprenol N-acetyl-beta-D-mannosaminyltransferase